MAKKKSVRQCKNRRDFIRVSERQGADVTEGSNHTKISTSKGASFLSRGSGEYNPRYRSAVVKQLLLLGLKAFPLFLLISWMWAVANPENAQLIMATR